MQNAKISEVFKSIQGEGPLTGIKQVFVRFYDCNIRCVWCDTTDFLNNDTKCYKEYTVHQLYDEVLKLAEGCHSVSLTGGEPLLYEDFIKDFLTLLKKSNLKIYLETNGILFDELGQIIEDIDFVSMDIKLPSSAGCGSFWSEHERFLSIARSKNVFIKIVIADQTEQDDIVRAAQLIGRADRNITLILQPNHREISNGVVKKCIDFQNICLQYLNDVRTMPQMHKILNLR